MLKRNFKNIIFDLGEVIIDVDENRTLEAFRELAANGIDPAIAFNDRLGFFQEIETGKISHDAFRREIRSTLNSNLTNQQIDDAWCAMLVDVPEKRCQLLRDLKNSYNTFALSNTSPVHIEWLNAFLEKKFGITSLDSLFSKAYYSFDIALRKPDNAVFQVVIDENNLEVEKTLFIDDKLENILAAQKIGLQTFHLTDKNDLFGIFYG